MDGDRVYIGGWLARWRRWLAYGSLIRSAAWLLFREQEFALAGYLELIGRPLVLNEYPGRAAEEIFAPDTLQWRAVGRRDRRDGNT